MRNRKKKKSSGRANSEGQGRKPHETALFSALSIAQMVNVINGGHYEQ